MMKYPHHAFLAALALGLAAGVLPHTPAASADRDAASVLTPNLGGDSSANPPKSEFRDLFNGRDMNGWHARPHFDPRKVNAMTPEDREAKIADWTAEAKKHWIVKDAALVNDGRGPYLVTDAEFEDFELRLEYKTVARADSGIYLKATPQVQIWDHTDPAKFKHQANLGSGGLWNNGRGRPGKNPSRVADKPFGQWNTVRVVQVGARTTVWLNDIRVVDHATMDNYWDRENPLFRRGPIALQTHGGEIQWRKIRVREFNAAEANAILAAHGDDGFTPVFDGQSLAGWTGSTDDYEVVNGAIRCKSGRGGLLLTEGVYGDFSVRLQFRLPPGGNNGLAIRSPGAGDAAYAAMTELQVLDSTHPKYAKLDARQHHGSAYGMAAAKRGFLRPTGQWNFQQVTVRGSKITVELNGTVILDTDLDKIDTFLADKKHPGKDRTEGHFGLAGHSDPVEFKDIAIRKLDPAPAE